MTTDKIQELERAAKISHELSQRMEIPWSSFIKAMTLNDEDRPFFELCDPETILSWAERDRNMEIENARLRAILPEILKALNNGAGCSPECSLEFLEQIPGEVRAVISKRDRKMREALEYALEFADMHGGFSDKYLDRLSAGLPATTKEPK